MLKSFNFHECSEICVHKSHSPNGHVEALRVQNIVCIISSSESEHSGYVIFQPVVDTPIVDKTNGVNIEWLTLRTHWSYCFLFSCSCLRYTEDRGLI